MGWLKAGLEFLAANWLGNLLGIVGLVAAYVFYVRVRQRKRIAHYQIGQRLLGLAKNGLPKGISVQFLGRDIPRLTRALAVIWNAGEKTIAETDVVTSDPLRLTFPEADRVLAASVLKQVRNICAFEAKVDASGRQNEVQLSFSFLDAGDGALLELLHTSEERTATVNGTLRGLPQGFVDLSPITVRTRKRNWPSRWFIAPRKLGMLLLGLALFWVWMTYDITRTTSSNGDLSFPFNIFPVAAGTVAAIYTIMIMLMGIALILYDRRPYPKALHTDELR